MPAKIQRRTPALEFASKTSPVAQPVVRRARLRARKVSSRALAEFTTQLATLIDAGLPVVRSLTILQQQMRKGTLRNVIYEVGEDVISGVSLSEAMAKHPAVFGRLYTNMVRAGEAGGVLDQVLRRLAGFLEKSQEIKDRIKGAMTYPIVVVLVAIMVLSIVFLKVIPSFEEIYSSFEIELPTATQILINTSRTLADYWYLFMGIPIVVGLLLLQWYRGSEKLQRLNHRLLLRTPGIGEMIKKTAIGRFARTFGTLIQSGVPHLEALEIVRAAISNHHISDAVEQIRESVREGEGINRPMQASGMFDDLIVNMVEVGEETGELDRMLFKVADTYEAQVDRRLEIFFKILEPAMLIIMALIVGGIIIALFVPILKIMETLGR